MRKLHAGKYCYGSQYYPNLWLTCIWFGGDILIKTVSADLYIDVVYVTWNGLIIKQVSPFVMQQHLPCLCKVNGFIFILFLFFYFFIYFFVPIFLLPSLKWMSFKTGYSKIINNSVGVFSIFNFSKTFWLSII